MENQTPNVLLVITDQQRANLHLPAKWQHDNLPAMKVLRDNGVEFINGFCNSCMCSPSRTTLMTSRYPAITGVTDTLSFGGQYSVNEVSLDPALPNMAKMLRPLYDAQYRGKWHLSKGGMNDIHAEKSLLSIEVATFGFDGWVAPDSGEDTKLPNFGGGYADNDTRYIEEAVQYIRNWNRKKENGENPKPFFMIVSLVNPHDVLAYPRTYADGGYTEEAWLEGDQILPPSVDEDLLTNWKPAAHWQIKAVMGAALGSMESEEHKQGYINFYANLVKLNDEKIAVLMEEFYHREEGGNFGKAKKLAEETLIIRLSDHGEMGLAHGGLRQKAFLTYEEAIRVPMIYSNPVFINNTGEPIQTRQLGSLIDVMPTIAGLLGMDQPEGARGRNLSPAIKEPHSEKHVQDAILFTFDDIRAGNVNKWESVSAANRIRCVRTTKWKYARYFHQNGSYIEAFEMYYMVGQGYDQNPTIKEMEEMPPAERQLVELLLKYPLEYVNLAYDKNPIMENWPKDVRTYISENKATLIELLKAEELRKLTFNNLEIRKKVGALGKRGSMPTN